MADINAASTPVLGSVIAALAIIPPLLANGISWAKDLNSSSRRQRVIDEATKSIAFWDAWLKAQGSQIGEAAQARYDSRISQIAGLVDRMPDPDMITPFPKLTLFRRLTLIAKSPSDSFSSFRSYFYTITLMAFVKLLQLFKVVPEFPHASWHVPVWLSWGRFGGYLSFAILIFFAIGFYAASVEEYRAAEKKHSHLNQS